MKKKIVKIVIPVLILFLTFFVVDPINQHIGEASDKKDFGYTECIPVLTFHRLVPDEVKNEVYPNNQWVGSVSVFAQMMEYLYNNGYETINTEEFYEWYVGNREYNKKTVMITFDDGFYEDYYLALPILKKYNFKATSFVVGSRIKDITRPYNKKKTAFIGLDVINKVRQEYPNFEFQSHSYNMHYYTSNNKHRIKSMSYEELENDVMMNERFGFTSMAYPYGDFNKNIQKILEEKGYLVAFRFGPSNYATRDSDRFAIPRIKINGTATINNLIKWLDY